jgi:mono/diheme cytochrome c family protein
MDTGIFIINLTQSQSTLLKYLLILFHLILIVSAGIVLGGLLLSLAFRISAFLRKCAEYREFSTLIVRDTPGRAILWIFGLLLPYASQSFILLQLYNGVDFKFFPVLLCGFLMMFISFLFFYIYIVLIGKNNLKDPLLLLPGIIAFVLLCGSVYAYSSVSALLLDPEKWLFTEYMHKAVLTWNGVTKFLSMLLFLFSVAGTWLIVNVSRKKYNYKFINNFSPAFLISTVLPQPLLILWNAVLVPYQSITQNIIIVVFIFLMLAIIAFSGLKILESGDFSSAGKVLPTLLIIILLSSINDLIARERAMKGQVLNLKPLLKKVKVEEEVGAEKKASSKGEEVFKRVCSGCHSFTNRIVGPAFKTVVPKYKDKKELKAFIKNPVKKNPEFPQMPPPGLSDEEIDAIADYLMEEVKNER